jgi:hypothetical protein
MSGTETLRAVAFAGIGMKLGSLVVDDRLAEVSMPILGATVLLAVAHALKPTWVEIGVVGVLVPVLLVEELASGRGAEYQPWLVAWLIMIGVLAGVSIAITRVAGFAMPGRSGSIIGSTFVGLAGIVALGFDLFDPVWQIAMTRWLGTDIGILWFFVGGVALVIAVSVLPTFTAAILASGLVISEILVRGIFCADSGGSTGPPNCGSSVAILGVTAVFLLVRGFVAARAVATVKIA